MNKCVGYGVVIASLMTLSTAQVYAKEKNVGPNWRAAPVYTTASLAAGFQPDPWIYDIQAGGSQEVSGLGSDCVGYINYSAPDIDLNYQAGSILPLHIYVRSSSDTTLIVYGPDGRWYCNDDSSGLNPMVTFNNPASGNYNIWVGVFGSDELRPARVLISELTPSD